MIRSRFSYVFIGCLSCRKDAVAIDQNPFAGITTCVDTTKDIVSLEIDHLASSGSTYCSFWYNTSRNVRIITV